MIHTIRLRYVDDPFQLDKHESKQVPYVPGEPVFYYAQSYMLPEDEIDIIHNTQVIEPEEFHTLVPDADDHIFVLPRVAGGGRGGKSILASIASIGLMMLSFGIGNIAEGYLFNAGYNTIGWGFWGYAAATGTMYVGGQLLNTLFPAPKQEEVPSQTYAWSGIQPLVGQNNPLPVVFGEVRCAGQVIAKHVSSDGEQSYLNLLISAGEGPCEYTGDGEDNDMTSNFDSGDVTGISKIKIGGNDIENYSGVTVYKRAGLNNQSQIPNFNCNYYDQTVNVELMQNGTWSSIQSTENEVEGLEFTFSWPGGLYDITGEGGYGNDWVQIEVQYSLHDQNKWISNIYTIPGNTRKGFFLKKRFDNLPKDKYDAKCRFVGCQWPQDDPNGKGAVLTTYWQQLSGITYDDFSHPNKVLLGIKALATNQLNGGLPTVTYNLKRSKVWVWNSNTGHYEQKPATNPAWACYWMLHRVYWLKNINTGQFEPMVKGVLKERLLYSEFEAWAAFCDAKGLQVNIYFDSIAKLQDQLKEIEQLGRGRVFPRGTKYGCVWDAPAQKDAAGNFIYNQVFNMSNTIAGSFNQQFVSIDDRATAIEVTYWEKENNYERTTIFVPADGFDEAAALVNPTQITLKGCNNCDQAWREGKYRLRVNNIAQTCSLGADVDAITVGYGDLFGVQHDVPMWGLGGRLANATANTITLDKTVLTDIQGNAYYDSGKSYCVLIRHADDTMEFKQVQSVDVTGTVITLAAAFNQIPAIGDLYSFGEVNKVVKPFKLVDVKRSGELRYTLTGLEYIDEIYTEATNVPEINYAVVETTIKNVLINDYVDKSGIIWLNIAWTPTQNYNGARIEIDGVKVGQVGLDQTNFVYTISAIKEHTVSVIGLSYLGLNMAPITKTHTVGGSIPPDPVSYIVYQNMRQIEHVWSTPGDIAGVVIRKLDHDTMDWNNGQPVNILVMGNKFSDSNINPGLSVYGIKTVGKNGLYSSGMKTASVNVQQIPLSNIIVALDEFETLDGICTDCYIQGKKVVVDTAEVWDDTTNDTWDDSTNETWDTPTVPGAIYLTQVKDLGKVFASDVKLSDVGFIKEYDVQWRYSEEGQTCESAEWQSFVPGKYKFRYHQWKIIMSSSCEYAAMTRFKVLIDVPDVIIKYPNEKMPQTTIADADSGLRIDFEAPFTKPPIPSGSPIGTTGYLVFTELDEEHALIKIKDETGYKTGNIAVQFLGY